MEECIKQIVCISTHYWDDPWFRKQQFMSRLAEKGFKVAYIEPTFSMVRKPDESKKSYATNDFFKTIVQKKKENLYVIKPPKSLPFHTNPRMSMLNSFYQCLRIRNVLKSLGFNNYILLAHRSVYAINLLKYIKLIFDITDDLAAYNQNNPLKYNGMKACMEQMAIKSDIIIVTASTLFEKYKQFAKNNNIYLIPNGYDSNLFSNKITSVPDEINKITKPIIGFVGTLFSFLDYELLEYIIKMNSDKSFVFIGNCENNSVLSWNKILKYTNVFWLGKKRKEEIPAYIKGFDVCINPFKVDDVSKSVSPLKVFEYLAMKKPVVSTKMESLEREKVAPFIYFANSYEDFNKKVNIALEEKDIFSEKLDYEIVREYSWDNLFAKIFNLIKDL